eukprot:Gb_29355 [translate_table: standard]
MEIARGLMPSAIQSIPPSKLAMSPKIVSTRKHCGSDSEYKIYVSTMALRAAPGVGQWTLSTAYAMGLWELQHFMTVLKPAHKDGPVSITCLLCRYMVKRSCYAFANFQFAAQQ